MSHDDATRTLPGRCFDSRRAARLIDRAAVPALAGLLGGAGIIHFVRPGFFEPLIPPQLTSVASRRDWVYASGAGELACAGAVALPSTRRLGGYASAALFVAVFPGNIQMAVDYARRRRPAWQQAIAYGRLPLQVPLVALALRVARRTQRVTAIGDSRDRGSAGLGSPSMPHL